jgi:exodeoxyribonuclease V gamma subunit
MSIQLFVSNALPKLAAQMASDLKQNKTNVFAPEQIITQTEGMNNWLKIRLSEHLGIAANLVFGKPSDLISKIYYLLGGFSKPILGVDYIKWNLYHILSEQVFKDKFSGIAKYYSGNDVKQIALASKLADLFDQYQIYRPEIIEQWSRTELVNVVDDFQEYLWVRLQEIVNKSMLDKTNIIQEIIEHLKQEEKQELLKSSLPHIQFFGIAVITPFYLNLFNELAKHIDIRFYLLNPAPTMYWLEDKSEKEIARFVQKFPKIKRENNTFGTQGNELLNSWGTIIKDSFSLLFQDEMYINSYNDDLAEEPSEPVSLLQKIQYDIFNNADREVRVELNESDLSDGSVQINACYTIVREVEVLYNYLVDLVEHRNNDYSPRDFVVMASDIDTYAPYILAVFDNAPYRFPYTIADEHINVGNSIFNAIEQILSLQLEAFKTEDIMVLFESKYIRERFGIQDVSLIRRAIEAANIRFGQRGNKENGTHVLSWDYGLKRILYGICISGETIVDIDGETLIPLDAFEGSDTYDLIRFWYFMQELERTLLKRNTAMSVVDWGKYIQELVEDLVFQSSEQEDDDYHRLIQYLERLSSFEEISAEPISFDVFRHSFLEVLNTETKAKSFASAGITFCSLIPMRSIPFKVVAMLGMNFDKFPRKENEPSFNLIEQKKRKGDRNVKDNDKHLFLETILSAEQNFYVSYIGRSAKDAVPIPPSSLVDELIEYIVQGVNKTDKNLYEQIVSVHPLQGFSQKYFNGSGLKTYLSDANYASKDADAKAESSALELNFDEIALSELLNFIKDPIKFYFNKRLGIYYREESILLPDTEVFDFDALSNWKIKDDLLKLPADQYEPYFERQNLMGNFPLMNAGKLVFQKFLQDLQVKITLIEAQTKGQAASAVSFNFKLAGHILSGKSEVYGEMFLAWSDSSNNKKHVVVAYLEYLVLTAAGNALDFCFIDLKRNKDFWFKRNAISQAEAEQELIQYLEFFKSAYQEPFMFCPALPGNPLNYFNKGPEAFVSMVKLLPENPKNFFFKGSEYNSKALEYGFFEVEHAEKFEHNNAFIFGRINSLMPKLSKLWK